MLEKLDIQMQNEEMNLDRDLKPFIKINPKWIRVLSVKCKTTTLQKDNIWENLGDLGFGD